MIHRACLFSALFALSRRLPTAGCRYDFYQPQVQRVTAPDVRILPGVPMFGKLRVGSFQPVAARACPSRKTRLENRGAMTSNAWN